MEQVISHQQPGVTVSPTAVLPGAPGIPDSARVDTQQRCYSLRGPLLGSADQMAQAHWRLPYPPRRRMAPAWALLPGLPCPRVRAGGCSQLCSLETENDISV